MKNITYNAAYSEVFESVLQIISKFGLNKECVSLEKGEIIASTGFSLFSWGEKVVIKITKGKQTEISVSSTPEAQLFDWGKSQENEEMIIRELNNRWGGR